MSKNLFKGTIECTMVQYEALENIDQNKDYVILDYPFESITNSQMEYALTCKKLFPVDSIFTCSDEGTYLKDTTYILKMEGSTKHWEIVSSPATVEIWG